MLSPPFIELNMQLVSLLFVLPVCTCSLRPWHSRPFLDQTTGAQLIPEEVPDNVGIRVLLKLMRLCWQTGDFRYPPCMKIRAQLRLFAPPATRAHSQRLRLSFKFGWLDEIGVYLARSWSKMMFWRLRNADHNLLSIYILPNFSYYHWRKCWEPLLWIQV